MTVPEVHFWKRVEIASGLSDLSQGLYKQPALMSESAVQGRVHPQSDSSAAKVQLLAD